MAQRSAASLHDPARLEAVRRLGLEGGSSDALDRLARLASEYLQTPTALVTLVHDDHQVLAGLAISQQSDDDLPAVRETPIDYSYCQHVVDRAAPLIVNDAREDPLLCTHPALLELGAVSYIGIPIVLADGLVLGSFCAVDTEPRDWTPEQVSFLTDLTASVVTEFELRHELAERARSDAKRAATEVHYRRLATGIPQGVYVLDAEGRFTELNAGAEHILGRTSAELLGQSFGAVISPHNKRPMGEIFRSVISGASDDVEFETWITRPSGEERLLVVTASAIEGDGIITGMHGIARDVTEERAAATALIESEERFREIAANVRDVFWTFTPDFARMLYMSPAFEDIFDQSLDALNDDARSFLDRVHPADRDRLVDAMSRVAETPVMGVEYRVVRRDGSVRWVRARGYPVRDDAGEVVRVVGTIEDITERKASESALRDSERQLREILDSLPIGAVLVEQPGRISWHNAAADRIWGGMRSAEPDAYAHYHGYDTTTGREIEPLEWPLARALFGEVVEDVLIDIDTFDGRRRTTLNTAVPLHNAAGEVTAAIGVTEDVTDARARDAEQRLLAAALEGLSEGICLITPEGEIVYANETFTRMLGVDPERVPGLLLSEFAGSPEAELEQQDHLRYAIEHGRWSGRVHRPRMSDGEVIPIDLVLGRVEHDEGPRLLFGIVQDATAEIEREQHLRRAERLASVGTMIGGVAHELNNPLQAILNYAQLLMLEERSPEDRDALGTMEREAQRMAKIVADLKQIARSTQETSDISASADLNDVVRHVMKVQEYRMRTSNIEVRLDLGADLPRVLADRGQLEQVLVNLVVNAEQAMASVKGARLILRTRASARGASLHVVDNGHGIPAHQLERIFDPFFTTKAPGDGTGLGLSLVHSIVTEHGGEIRVDSEIGTGTAFRLDWLRSVEHEHPPEPRAVAVPADRPKSLRVLVVDDEAPVRSVMARYLTRRGHTVEQAADGSEALRMLDGAEYDVILSDLRMPGLGGEAMMERLRERGLSDSVIFMTGDAAGAATRLGEMGVPVLLKPVELAEVARAVETRRG